MSGLSKAVAFNTYKMKMAGGVLFTGLLLTAQASQAATTTINANGFGTTARTSVTVADSLIYRVNTPSTDPSALNTGIFTQGGGSDISRQLLVFEYNPALVQNTGSLKLTFTFNFSSNSGNAARRLNFWDVGSALTNTASTFTSATALNVLNSFPDLGSCSGAGCADYAEFTMPKDTTTTFTQTIFLSQQAISNLKSSGKFGIGVDATVGGNSINALGGRISDAKLVAAVPLPPAALLFGPAVLAVGAVRRKKLFNKAENT